MHPSLHWLLCFAIFAAPAGGLEADLEVAQRELEEMDRREQAAFIAGDCDAVLDLMSDDVSFYANGREMTKEAVGAFCRRIPRPFPQAAESETVIRALAPDAGYVLRTLAFPGSSRVEVVTKIWTKGPEGWKMEHFQSTVTDVEPAARP